MRKLITFLFVLALVPVMIAQTLSGRVSSSVFNFERFDTARHSTFYARAYQQAQLNLNYEKYSLRTSFNYEHDLDLSHSNPSYFRVYTLYVEGREIFDIATVRIGRIPIFSGIAAGVFDGGSIKVDYKKIQFDAAYGGVLANHQDFGFAKNISDNYAMAFNLSTTAIESFKFGAGYSCKNYKPDDYYALRLDDHFNPINMLIQQSSTEYEFLHGAVDFEQEKLNLNAHLRYEYDLNIENTSKIELESQYGLDDNLDLNIYGSYREPRVRYNSIFSVFDYGNTKEGEIGATYHLSKTMSVGLRGGYTKYKDDDASRASVAFNSEYGSVSYRQSFGYAGEMQTLALNYAHTFKPLSITPSVGVAFTGYKLNPDDDRETLTSVVLGVNMRPIKQFSVDLQGQYMNNRIYKDDVRFLLKLNYWFFTKL